MKNKITEKLIKDYQNNGWVKVENFIAKKDISTVKKMINNYIKSDLKKSKKISRHVNFV